MDRSQIADTGVIATFKTIFSKTVDQLDAGEKNFVREWKEYFSETELAPFASLFEVAPETEEVEESAETVPEVTEETEKEQETETAEEEEKGTDSEPMTDDEIRGVLLDRGVKFRSNATRETLLKLLSEQEAE